MSTLGGCHCGAVRYEVTGELGPLVNCHCRYCRRFHGAAFVTVSLVVSGSFRVTQGEGAMREFANAEGSRHFCGECGTRLFNRPKSSDAFLMLVVGSLDEDPGSSPIMHVNTESKAGWYEILDALPRYAAMPPRPGDASD